MLVCMFWKKLSALLFSIFLLLLTVTTIVHAQSNSDYFDTHLHTTVTVNETGQSRIKHEFTITNKTPATYISQYGLKVSSSKIKNVSVISNGQSIKPEVVPINSDQQSGPGQTSIGITFPDELVGQGKKRKFTISYTHPDAAVISGNVLEVTLPPQANPADYSSYKVTLITPARFDGPVRTTPAKHNFTNTGNQIITTFEGGEEHGVFALFGQQQFFELNLNYHLTNSTNNPGITQIALPPDTIYQRVDYHSLTPTPRSMETDPDGNWIATYELPAGSNTQVNLQATVKLSLKADPQIPIIQPDDSLLKSQKYWPVDHPELKKIAAENETPQKINDYVVKTLNYNTKLALNLPERLGAVKALNHPQDAVCQEFTDLFITLARAAGIPARRITGYAYSKNSELRPLSLVEDILHAWPEYYNPIQKIWVPIDPTWENTTGGVDYFHQLDLNHIVFAINGHNSITPYPAGSYKDPDSSTKTVFVKFGEQFPEHKTELALHLKPQKLLNSLPLPGSYLIEITNLSGQAEYNLPLTIQNNSATTQAYTPQDQIAILLPFQTLSIPIKIRNIRQFKPVHDTITIKLQNETQEFDVISSPPINNFFQKDKALAMAGGAIFATLIAGSILVFRRKK